MIIANNAESGTPQFRVLSDSHCRSLVAAAIECLARIGVVVENADALDLLAAAGARVEHGRVRIPEHLVQDALSAAPGAFDIWGRDPARTIHVAPNRVHFGPGLTNTYYIDPETGERRLTRRGDPALTARVADALPNIDWVLGLGLIGDIEPPYLASVYEFAELLANTTKPILAWAHRQENVADIYRMAVVVAGSEATLRDRPLFAFFATYPSPLRHTNEDLANVLWAAEHGIPIIYLGGPTVGLESPMTAASALVIHLAAVLSGLVIVQRKRRGAPMAFGSVPSAMDLRTARPAYGSPEMSLNSAAAAELARYLGVPFMGTAGASESKVLDAQAGIEAAVQVVMSALSGAALVHDVGFLDCADIGSLAMLVMTDEIVGMARRLMRGIDVRPETIMLDLIEKIGPGGHFLEELESVSLSRREVWVPTLMDRSPHVIWQEAGGKDLAGRAHERVRKILHTHRPAPLPENAQQQIDAILQEAVERHR